MCVCVCVCVCVCACMLSCFIHADSVHCCGLQATRLLCPWNSLGKSTGVVCHALLQGSFLTQGSNTCLLRVCVCIHFNILFHCGLSQVLNIVPCAVQQNLVVYLFHTKQFAYVSASPQIPVQSSPITLPFDNHRSILCESVSISQIGSFLSYFRFHV